MNPKSGKTGSPVDPAAPEVAEEAAVADPGEAAKVEAKKAKDKKSEYETASFEPHKPTEEDIEEKTWIEIELVDEEDNPVPGEKYKVTLPNDKVAQGTLDNKGFAHIGGIEPCTCQITFPNLDKDAWEKA